MGRSPVPLSVKVSVFWLLSDMVAFAKLMDALFFSASNASSVAKAIIGLNTFTDCGSCSKYKHTQYSLSGTLCYSV